LVAIANKEEQDALRLYLDRLGVSRQLLVSIQHFNTARRYARAAFAVVYPSVCPSVRPSQAGIVSKRLDESSWVLAWRLLPRYPIL